MTKNTEVYIADGVYASFDGFQIWLRVNRGGGDEMIALDDITFDGLLDYAAKATPFMKGREAI